jgi:DNA-binding transcriptional LysR family regulator
MPTPVLPETRSMLAAVTLAEELNFTRASIRLGSSQSGLSRRINELEDRLKLKLFIRDRIHVALSPAGKAFTEKARKSLFHAEATLRMATTISAKAPILHIGRSPYASPLLTDALLAIRLERYPKLKVKLHSNFAGDLTQQVMTSKLDMALIANPTLQHGLTSVVVDRTSLCAVISNRHRLGRRTSISFKGLESLNWILFDRKANTRLHDFILSQAKREGVAVKEYQAVLTVDEGLQVAKQGSSVAFIAQSAIDSGLPSGLIAIPIADKSFVIATHLVSRKDDPAKLVGAFARAYVNHLRSERLAAHAHRGMNKYR